MDSNPVSTEQMLSFNSSPGFLMLSLCSHASLSGSLGLKLPSGQPDWLLVVFFHYFSDSEQVTPANGEVAPGGPYCVANLTLFSGEAVAISSGCYSVLSRVQQAPVITISSCEETQTKSRFNFFILGFRSQSTSLNLQPSLV